VQVGTGVGDLVAVSGLDAGTRVVLNPPEDLTEGRTVKEVAQ
jgi:hypothetical protein